MPDASISGLPTTVSDVEYESLVPVVITGVTVQKQVDDLRFGMRPVSSDGGQGMMAPLHLIQLNTALDAATAFTGELPEQVIASASSITIADFTGPVGVVILSGTTNVTAISTPGKYKLVIVHYPSGAGLTFMGAALTTGSTLVCVLTP